MRLKAKVSLGIMALLIINCFVIILSAPSSLIHPIRHWLAIILGVANLAAVPYLEYLVEWDPRKNMKI